MRSFAPVVVITLVACEGSVPSEVRPDAGNADAPAVGCNLDEGTVALDAPGCGPSPGDYRPRELPADDGWPPCGADQGVYVPFDPNVSSLGRVAAFEQIRVELGIGTTRVPTARDFLDARVIYTQEQGLESRIVRREDEHFPKAPAACRDLAPEVQQTYPDRCVGWVKIRPILNDAFARGSVGEDPLGNASRIEAALLWFFYVSTHKEATSCADKAVDCDSMWAKYTGGEPRTGGAGLSAYVRARSPQAHDRVYDGLLAVRCWRDLDNPTGVATDLVTRDKARAQLDRALLRGIALIVRQRALRANGCTPAWESVRILGGVLAREAAARDAAKAQTLASEVGKSDPRTVDMTTLVSALDSLFPCP